MLVISEQGIGHIIEAWLKRFNAALTTGDKLVRTFFYYCMPYQGDPPSPDDARRYSAYQKFISFLGKLNRFELRQGRLAFRGTDAAGERLFEQKGVDVMLAIDLFRMATSRQIQKAVLVTGDSDFVPAIKLAKDEGMEVVLYYDGAKFSRDLIECCDVSVPIEKALIDAAKVSTAAPASRK